MAVDSEVKRWSMLALSTGAIPSHVFNPDTSGLVSVEKITVLQHYGGIAWGIAVLTTNEIFPRYFKATINNDAVPIPVSITNLSFASTLIANDVNAQVTVGSDLYSAVRIT